VQRIPDVLQDRLSLAQHRIVPIPTDAQSPTLEKTRPLIIPLGGFSMLAAIEFDDEPRFTAIEINDIRRDRVLPTKLPASEPATPEQQP